MAGIEDLLKKASNPKHEREAKKFHRRILEDRMENLKAYYVKGLSGDEQAKFKAMSVAEQNDEIAKNRYKLKQEHADQLAADTAVYILKKHNEKMGNELAKMIKIASDSKSKQADKEEAMQTINLYKTMLRGMGFDWDGFASEGGKAGFSEGLYNKHMEKVPDAYIELNTKHYLDMISEDEAYAHLEKIGKPLKLKTDLIKEQGLNAVRGVLADHYALSQAGDLDGFKDRYHHLIKEEKKKKPSD